MTPLIELFVMVEVRNISIKNYRGIKDIHFPPKAVNIFVGPNNCGKSSILEAIALNLTSSRNFKDSVDKNIWDELIKQRQYNRQFLINENERQAEIICDDLKLTIEFFKIGLPDDDRGKKIIEYFLKRINNFLNSKNVFGELFDEYRMRSRITDEVGKSQKTLFDIEEDLNVSNYFKESFSIYLENVKNSIMYQIMNCEKIIITGMNNKNNYDFVLFDINIQQISQMRYNPIFRRFLFEISREGIISIYGSPQDRNIGVIVNLELTSFPKNISHFYDLAVKKNKIKETVEGLKNRLEYLQDQKNR